MSRQSPTPAGSRSTASGSADLRYPILLASARPGRRRSIAEWELTVELDAEQRGTHMSRFVETLEALEHRADRRRARLLAMLADTARPTRDAARPTRAASFTLFIERRAPVSGQSAQHAIDCSLRRRPVDPIDERAEARRARPDHHAVPVQQGDQRVRRAQPARLRRRSTPASTRAADLAFEDLIEVAEASGSAPIYPLLKRVDERHVTMQAYDAPTFVEDVVRTATLALARRPADPSASPSRPRTTRASTTTRRSPPSAGSGDERPHPGDHHLHESQGARCDRAPTRRAARAWPAPATVPAERLYAGEQHRRLMAGVDALRAQRPVEVWVISAQGRAGLRRGRTRRPTTTRLPGCRHDELRARADRLGIAERRSVGSSANPCALTLLLVGNDYFDAARLDEPVDWAVADARARQPESRRTDARAPQLRAVAVGQALAKRWSLPLTLLKGEIVAPPAL